MGKGKDRRLTALAVPTKDPRFVVWVLLRLWALSKMGIHRAGAMLWKSRKGDRLITRN